MSEVMQGANAAWIFEVGAVRIRYERRLAGPWLLRELRERVVPYEALRDVTLAPGRRGKVVLRAVPRHGADPVVDVAGAQLRTWEDPYRLVLPRERELLAEAYADEIRQGLGPATPADRFLVDAPLPPRRIRGWDGSASFDGEAVTLRWDWLTARRVKYNAGEQRYPVTQLEGVEWHRPETFGGHVRLYPAGGGTDPNPDKDLAALVASLGWPGVVESLLFAASVAAAIGGRRAVTGPRRPRLAAGSNAGAEEVAERLRQLSRLHREGVLTDEEFQAKKAELLADL